jgi:hypothetical protein
LKGDLHDEDSRALHLRVIGRRAVERAFKLVFRQHKSRSHSGTVKVIAFALLQSKGDKRIAGNYGGKKEKNKKIKNKNSPRYSPVSFKTDAVQ